MAARRAFALGRAGGVLARLLQKGRKSLNHTMSNTPPYPKDMPAFQSAGDNPSAAAAAAGGRSEPESSGGVDLRAVADAVNAQVVKTPIQSVLIAFGVGAALGMMFSSCGSYRE